jgi:hypothetical protein
MTSVSLNATGLASVSVIETLWPAPSTPEVGETVSSPSAPEGTVIVKLITGPPAAVRVNEPPASPPVALAVSMTAAAEAVSVPLAADVGDADGEGDGDAEGEGGADVCVAVGDGCWVGACVGVCAGADAGDVDAGVVATP